MRPRDKCAATWQSKQTKYKLSYTPVLETIEENPQNKRKIADTDWNHEDSDRKKVVTPELRNGCFTSCSLKL